MARKEINILFGFGGNLKFLWIMIGLSALFLFGFVTLLLEAPTKPDWFGLLMSSLITGGIAWGYWWWHERRDAHPAPEPYIAPSPKIITRPMQIPRGPSTPGESAKALLHLRVCRSLIDDDFYPQAERDAKKPKGPQKALGILGRASQNLQIASQLDPSVRLTVDYKEGPYTFDQDMLAGELLFIEATLYKNQGDYEREQAHNDWIAEMNAGNNDDLHKIDAQAARDEEYNIKRALSAIDKALQYQPRNPAYLVKAAELYQWGNNEDQARQYADRAIALVPDDIQTIKAVQSLGLL